MEKKRFSLDEVEIRIKFDLARSKYVVIYGESIFKKCNVCKGTGLYINQYTSEGPVWDCDWYCGDCNGYGGMFVLGEVIFECSECKSDHRYERIHCKKCNGSGYVDWVENIIGKLSRLPSSADDNFAKSQSFYSPRMSYGLAPSYKALKVPWSGV
jgi:hypothetical protein